MKRFVKTLAALVHELGSLVVFVVINHLAGLKPAIVVSALYTMTDVAWRLWRGRAITRIFKFSAAMTLTFGLVDVFSHRPFMMKYEAVVTNLVTAWFFGASLFGEKTLIQDFYEKRHEGETVRPDLVVYFRWLTMVWVGYFLAKAGLYAWIAHHSGLERMLVVRAIVGGASFYALLGLSIFGSPYIVRALRRWGVLPELAPEHRPP